MNSGLEAREKKAQSGKGKAKDVETCVRHDSDGAESDSDITSTATYTVRKGDTIYSIAKKFRVSPDAIIDLNNIKNSKIVPGMKLKVPGDSAKKKAAVADKKNTRQTEKKNKTAGKEKPDFKWPLKKIKKCEQDGDSGAKSIGIFIKGAPNADVYASADGVVKKIGYMRGYGKYIIISHDDRYVTIYSNMEQINVKEGDSVTCSSRLGRISNDSTLHFQIGRAGKAENPLKYLPARS